MRVTKAFDVIDDKDEVIANYCDFSVYWDFFDFLEHTRAVNADGAIPAYKGFHPYMMGSTNYAFIRDDHQMMLEIQEKLPFTKNRMEEYASQGTYYFKKGSYIKKYFPLLMEKNIHVGGEFYVSLVYNLMQEDDLSTYIYETQHMLQWGTPQDLEEYEQWSHYFLTMAGNYHFPEKNYEGALLIPMAGAGQRFQKEGYIEPKPLIKINEKFMILKATETLPKMNQSSFIMQEDHVKKFPEIEKVLLNHFSGAQIVKTNGLTEGQACTCELGLENLDLEKPLFISACDNQLIWNEEKWDHCLADSEMDVSIWAFHNNASAARNPEMYGWIEHDDNNTVTNISVKTPISKTPFKDYGVIGTFYFRKAQFFLDAIQRLYDKNIRINNEFYVDSCMNMAIELGLTVKLFPVDFYVCFGTPTDVLTFNCWQSFFDKWPWHPYRLEKDITIEKNRIPHLRNKFYGHFQPYN